MISTLIKKNTTEENIKKDFKKLANYVIHAKGQHRTIGGFAADCRFNDVNYLTDVVNARINTYPRLEFLKMISDNSQGRVTLNELTMACGYSNYTNNDMEQIKNIYVRRGWFCWVDYGQSLDSEYGLKRLSLIIQNNKGNQFSSTTICIPTTSRRSKASLPTHVFVDKNIGIREDSIISCEQVRCISKRRLGEKIAECPEHIMKQVEVALLRAQGVIELHISEQEAIEGLMDINRGKQRTYQYESNYAHNSNQQVACAF